MENSILENSIFSEFDVGGCGGADGRPMDPGSTMIALCRWPTHGSSPRNHSNSSSSARCVADSSRISKTRKCAPAYLRISRSLSLAQRSAHRTIAHRTIARWSHNRSHVCMHSRTTMKVRSTHVHEGVCRMSWNSNRASTLRI